MYVICTEYNLIAVKV